MANATTGLAVALQALKRPERSVVLIPSFTFAALPGVVRWAGLEPIFLDIEPIGWHVDPAALAEGLAIHGTDTAAVMVGSSFGVPPTRQQSAAWKDLCAEHAVPLIIDSAAGFGSTWADGHALGLQGDAEIFSFHATKPFAIGEGGLITTGNRDLHRRMGELVNFGFDADRVVAVQAGTNAKLSELQCATALAVLDKFDEVLQRRRDLGREYATSLEHSGWTLQRGSACAAWQFVPALAPSARERTAAVERCLVAGIETKQYYTPLHSFPAFADCPRVGDLKVTEEIAASALSLPLFNQMQMETARHIASVATGATSSG